MASLRVCLGLLQLLAPAVGAGGPLLPGMAWNSWNTFSVNGKPLRSGREGYQQIAEVMIERGYVKAGYRTLSTTCTDWQPRDPITHELQENHTLWPGGMKSFADWLHARGMMHGDVYLHNTLRSGDAVRLSDLGAATVYDRSEHPWLERIEVRSFGFLVLDVLEGPWDDPEGAHAVTAEALRALADECCGAEVDERPLFAAIVARLGLL